MKTKLGRPSTGKDGEKLNLWIEKSKKRRLLKMAFNSDSSVSAFVQEMIDAAWLAAQLPSPNEGDPLPDDEQTTKRRAPRKGK